MSDLNKRPLVGIGCIVMRNNLVLVGKRLSGHGAGHFQIPGGHLEFGESFEDAAIREVQEETGLTDLVVKEIVSLSNDIAFDKHYISIGVLLESSTGNPYNNEPEKCGDWIWCDPENLPQPFFPHSKNVIQNWLSGKIYQ